MAQIYSISTCINKIMHIKSTTQLGDTNQFLPIVVCDGNICVMTPRGNTNIITIAEKNK